MAGRKIQSSEIGKQSLLTTLNAFVEEVNAMNEKVMVPSRLRDMDVSDNSVDNADNADSNNETSLIPAFDCQGENLYSYYAMINAIKNEILSGHGHVQSTERSDSDMETSSTSSSDTESDDGSTDAARQTAEAFRHHLQGLFGVLNQLTNTAKVLGNTYEDQIGGSKKLRKFAI